MSDQNKWQKIKHQIFGFREIIIKINDKKHQILVDNPA
jgi:hypothetical protein